jgi:hypothetical protein
MISLGLVSSRSDVINLLCNVSAKSTINFEQFLQILKEASVRAPNGTSFLNDKTLNFEPGVRERKHKSKENQKLP